MSYKLFKYLGITTYSVCGGLIGLTTSHFLVLPLAISGGIIGCLLERNLELPL